ncbi:MAG: aldo/keto reductase [Burkholderiales bacterium]|nr:aldo/keto reductase [Burkholderiales bacterium]
MIGVFSLRLRNIPALDALVGQRIALVHLLSLSSITQIAGWGLRPSAVVARRFAAHTRIPFVHLEDGFLRSVGRGDMDPPLSIVVDDCGVYYDATRPSRLERLIPQPLDAGQHARASALIRAWKENQLSKYNHQRDRSLVLPERFVLVVDQTRGDASIEYGQATPATFRRMLDCALAENPQCHVVLKVHPDVVGGRKRGHFDYNAVAKNPRERRLLPLARERGVAVIVNRPFGGGGLFSRLRGKPVPKWAVDLDCESWAQLMLKFVISHPAVTCAIPATSKVEHVRDNMSAGRGRLPDAKQREAIVQAVGG